MQAMKALAELLRRSDYVVLLRVETAVLLSVLKNSSSLSITDSLFHLTACLRWLSLGAILGASLDSNTPVIP